MGIYPKDRCYRLEGYKAASQKQGIYSLVLEDLQKPKTALKPELEVTIYSPGVTGVGTLGKDQRVRIGRSLSLTVEGPPNLGYFEIDLKAFTSSGLVVPGFVDRRCR